MYVGDTSKHEGEVDDGATAKRDGVPPRGIEAIPEASGTGDSRSEVLETV